MDGWIDEVSGLWWDSHELLGWAVGQPWCSKWWSPWVGAQITWLHSAPPSSALFPLLLLGCSVNFTKILPVSSLLQFAQQGCELWGQPREEALSLVTHYEVNFPFLGCSQAWWGRYDFTWVGCTLWHLPLWWYSFLWGSQLLPAPIHSAWPREEVSRGLTWVEITGSHTWTIYHTHELPEDLLANIFSQSMQF